MVTSTIDATVTLLKERILLFLTVLATAPVECLGKGLWLACQSTGNSTGGRAHAPTSFAVRAKESSTCACFRANAWK